MAVSSSTADLMAFLLFYCLLLLSLGERTIEVGQAISPNDLIGDQCKRNGNPKTCLDILKSVPGTTKAKDAIELAIATIPVLTSKGLDTLSYIKELVKATKDPSLKSSYEACSDSYDSIVYQSSARHQVYIDTQDYAGLWYSFQGTQIWSDDFWNKLSTHKNPDPQLFKKNDDFSTFAGVQMTIADGLWHQ